MTGRVRRPVVEEAAQVAAVFRRSRSQAMPWLPVLHTPDEDLAFFTAELGGPDAWVADVGGAIAGFVVARGGWVDHLYVDPGRQGRGIGASLLNQALLAEPAVVDLWVFERNTAARVFYAHRGFVEVERTDGTGNEERMPDVRMRIDRTARLSGE